MGGMVMPDGDAGQGAAPAGQVDISEVLKARNIDPSKLGDILDGYSKDVPELRKRAKVGDEERQELERLRKAEEDRANASRTELERAQKAQRDAEALAEQRDKDMKWLQRNMLLERELTTKMRGLPEELADLMAEHVRATVPGMDWETTEDLTPIMEKQMERWSKLAPAGSGGAGIPFGAPGANGQPGQQNPPNVNMPPEQGGGRMPFLAAWRGLKGK